MEGRRLRILTCTFTCRVSGIPGFGTGEGVLGWNLLKQVARFHDVWTLTHADEQAAIEQELKEEPIPHIRFCYVDLPRWLHPLLRFQGAHQFYYYLWQIKAYFTARKLQKATEFDLFHHITYANDWMASYIGALLPVPYVRGPGGGAHRTPPSLEGEYSGLGRLWEKFRTLGQWIFRHDPFFIKGQSRASAILVCNQDSLDSMPRRWVEKTHLFPVSGISSKDLALAGQVKSNKHFHVISAGTLIKVKGFSLAIKAFKAFADTNPEATFSIVGEGPEGPKLQALVKRLNLENQVRFLQALPRDQLLSEMAASDVFLFPSLRDGGGTVVIEAMAVGKPVICLDTGGPAMHITEECGVKITPGVPCDTIGELAAALERLRLDNNLRTKLGRAGHERAEQLYHWDSLGDRIGQLYDSAVLPPAANRPTCIG